MKLNLSDKIPMLKKPNLKRMDLAKEKKKPTKIVVEKNKIKKEPIKMDVVKGYNIGGAQKVNRVVEKTSTFKPNRTMTVSKNNMHKGKKTEFLKFALAINRNRTLEMFKAMGVDSNGYDLEEVLKNKNFDFAKFLRNFETNTDEMLKAVKNGSLKTV